MASVDSAVVITDLHKNFGPVPALDGISLSIPRGAVFGMVGANGAGKTTTMRILLDLIRPTSGDVVVLGQNPRQGGIRARRSIGYLPGELHLDGKLKGKDLLGFLAKISGAVDWSYVEQLAERLGADLDRPIAKLSKGNKQKIGIIQAFMHRPELLVLDEPTSGLDPLVQRTVLDLVDDARQNGQTVLLSSHVLSEIQHSADQVAVILKGKIVAQGEISSFRLATVRDVQIVTEYAHRATIMNALKDIGVKEGITEAIRGTSIQINLVYHGEINSLLSALGQVPLNDVLISEPTLEDTVLAMYGGEAS